VSISAGAGVRFLHTYGVALRTRHPLGLLAVTTLLVAYERMFARPTDPGSFNAVDTHTRKPGRFVRANYCVRQATITLWGVLALVLFGYYVLATVLQGHPPFTLSWLRP
jgi:hypothetical protein